MATAEPRKRVVVGLSGGVDSAVSAWLLKQQGHEVVGVFMQNWTDDDDAADASATGDAGYCTSREDFLDAASVADVLGIEIEHVNFAAEYKERVFAEFLREYQAGRTPNPDVLCNAEIKFKAFLDHALALGADHLATGHYARVRRVESPEGGSVQLLRGVDPNKDQSYFLHRLTQAQLARTWFPVGELPKPEVRRIAAEIGLPVATKRDSTGICFIGERPFREFLNRYLVSRPGAVEDDRGRVVGEHVGLSFYTLGQRKGIGIGGLKARGAARGGHDHAPWFVARKDLALNVLVVVQGHDHPWLLSGALTAADASWVAGHGPPTVDAGLPSNGTATGALPSTTSASRPVAAVLSAKTRYRQQDASCRLLRDAATSSPGLAVAFDAPQWAVTPGQSVVFYDGEVCLGGAVIDASTPWRVGDAAVTVSPTRIASIASIVSKGPGAPTCADVLPDASAA